MILVESFRLPVGHEMGPCTDAFTLAVRVSDAGQYSQYQVHVSPFSQRAVAGSVAEVSVSLVAARRLARACT